MREQNTFHLLQRWSAALSVEKAEKSSVALVVIERGAVTVPKRVNKVGAYDF